MTESIAPLTTDTDECQPLPWQRAQWQQLSQELQRGTLPHALLLTGLPGVGHERLAQALAAAALCLQPFNGHAQPPAWSPPTMIACGVCAACRQRVAGVHPDARWIGPETGSEQIKVDQIRELLNFLSLTRRFTAYRVVLIAPADRMNRNAANALLKALEEPPPQTLMILVAGSAALLPATVRSRCRWLRQFSPPPPIALAWLSETMGDDDKGQAGQLLALAHGAPLQALALAKQKGYLDRYRRFQDDLLAIAIGRGDPLACAEAFAKDEDLLEILAWLHGLCAELVRARLAIRARDPVLQGNEKLSQAAMSIDLARAFAFHDRLLAARRFATTGVNQSLLLIDLLLAWQALSLDSR